MFGRVSTFDFSNYINLRNIGYVDVYGLGMGVVPAKKWTGTLSDKFAFWGGQQIEPNWIEVREEEPDEYGYIETYKFYPKYTQPTNIKLPDFVNLYREEDGKESYNSFRALIGDGTPSIGPFSLHEALYVYSVIKKINPEIINLSEYTASAEGASSSMSSVVSSDQDWNTADSSSHPSELFRAYQKNYVNYSSYERDDWSEGDTTAGTVRKSSLTRCTMSVAGWSYPNPFSIYGSQALTYIAVDVDEPEDYYIGGLFFSISLECLAVASAYRSSKPSANIKYADNSIVLRKEYDLKPFRHISFDDLSQVGQTSGYLTYVSVPFTYDFGNGITKSHNMYGVFKDELREDSYGDNPPSVSASLGFPVPDFKPKAISFWPYKNASDQSVYNTETGVIDNSPIP